ncbi:MAG: DUF11 domain-containing protein [Anaerolineae bacterium]
MNYRKSLHLVAIIAFLLLMLLGGLTGLAQAASGSATSRLLPLRASASPLAKPWETKPALALPAGLPANIPLLQGAPVLTITKSSINEGGAPLLPGERITYTIVLSNSGDVTATNVVVSDTFPTNTTFDPSSFEITPLEAGGTAGTQPILAEGITINPTSLVTVTYAVTVASGLADGTPIVNTATVTSAETIADPQTTTLTDTVTNQADLSISKTDGQTQAVPGQTITYTIVVVNNSATTPVANAIVSDTFPAALTSVTWNCSPAGGGSCTASGNNDITDSTVDLPANASVTYTVTGTVTSSATGSLTNTASVTVPIGVTDPDGSNNSATDSDTLTPQADLLISKSGAPDPVIAGNALTYTLTITNSGPSDATNTVVTDTLPAGVAYVSASGGCSNAGNTVTCTLGSLVRDAVVTRIIRVSIPSSTPASTIQNSVVISSATFDPLTTNNVATSSTTVNIETDLEISKSDFPDPVVAGRTLTYTLAITNHGPSDATGVVVTDTLPITGVSLVTATPSQGSGCSGATSITCNLGSLTSSNRATVTIVMNVSPAMTSTLTNTATVGSATTDSTSGNNSDTESTSITPEADLVISKSDNPEPVIAGQTLTYTIALTNNGPSYAQNVVVTDTLPVSLSLVSATPATATQNGQTLAWNFGTLTNGATQVITLVVTVGGDVRGQINNTATITSSTTDPTPGNNSDTEQTTATGQADLAVTKSDSRDPVNLLTGPFDYTIQITNTGPSDALGVVVTDTLPGTVSLFGTPSPSQGSCTGITTIICNLGKIVIGSNATVIISVLPSTPGIITNLVSATSNDFDPNTSNNIDTENTTVNPVDLVVTKTDLPDPVLVGNPLTYTLVVENDGPNAANNVVLTDTLPAGVQFKSATGTGASCTQASGTVTCSLGNIQPRTVTIVVTPTVVGVITNTAVVTSGNPDLVPANNTTTITTTVSPVADLKIAKVASSDPITAGTSLTYTLFVTNTGPSTATGVSITDTLPAGVSFVSASGCSGTTIISCSIPTLTVGSSVSRTIRVNVNSTTLGPLVNSATVTANEFDPTFPNTAVLATAVSRQVNLSITKTDAPDPVAAGASLTYNLTVSNAGPSSANGVVVTDTLPSGVTLVSASPGCSGTTTVICAITGEVASGGSAAVTIQVNVSLASSGVLTNTATVGSTESDSNPSNNNVTATTTITQNTDLSITKSDSPDPVTAGANLTYNLSVTNNGPSNATGVTVQDTLPAGVTFQSFTSGAPCSHVSGTVTCNFGALAAGNQATVAIVVKVNDTTTGNLINNATVTGNQVDPNSSNNSTSATTSVGALSFVFLPFLQKPAPTALSVFNDRTNGFVTFTVLGTGVSCTVPNNTTQFCGSFPPGTYTVQVASACGNATTTKIYESGPQTTRIFCE